MTTTTETNPLASNPFTPLWDAFPGDKFDEIGTIFDNAREFDAGDDQWKLNGLSILLSCLENIPESEGTVLSIPLLRNLQALQAAYELVRSSSVHPTK